METNSECKCCKTWEEDMYWTHFTSFHFFVNLPPNFHDHLVLPKKFNQHMKTQLPDKVSLKGPSGALWEVQLFKIDDLLFVGNEWKDFVKAHDLKENYCLMFKFIRNSTFEVLIFEQGSPCEKEASYFVKKCRHLKSDHGKRKTTSGSTEIIEYEGEEEEEDSTFVLSKKSGYTAPIRKGRLGEVQVSCILPRKGSVINETGEKAIQGLQKDAIGDGGSPPKNNKSQSKTNMNGNGIIEISEDEGEGEGDGEGEEDEKEGEEEEEEEEEDSTFVVSKKSECTASKRKTILEKVQVPCKLPRKGLFINETGDEQNQVSQRDVITPDNGGSLSKNYKSQSRTNLNGNDVAEKITSQVTRELLISENSENHNNAHQMKNQSEKQLNWDNTVKVSSQVSKRGLITPLSGESNRASGHQDQTEKELSGNGTAKELTKNSGPVVITPDYRENSTEKDHSPKTHGKRGRPKKKILSKSSKELIFRNEYKSNRRSVTDKEKREAWQRAIKKETEHSFTAILPPTSVYKEFYLNVPLKWLCDHLLHQSQDVVLRVGAETWSTSLFYHGRRRAAITTGWKKFALDNDLEESDVLVFNLSSPKDETPVLMDVDIFRVVPTTVNRDSL